MKLGRNYRVTIDMRDGNQIVIEDPLTAQFTIERTIASSMNTMNLVLFNLGQQTRDRIFQDWYATEPNTYRRIVFEAGYAGEYAIVFAGDLRSASSARSGTEILTVLQAFSGGFDTITAQYYETLAAGTTLRQLNENLVGTMPNLKLGAMGDNPDTFKRPVVLNGNSFYLMRKYNNEKVFVDNEIVNILQDDEAIEGDVQVINAATGLLETPRREDAFLTIATLFEPRIVIGQVIELQSSVQPIYDGQYKVVGANHQGIISGAVGGQCVSRFNLLLGQKAFDRLKIVQN
jgi:hypothetical protein